jgi:hypothetical protein
VYPQTDENIGVMNGTRAALSGGMSANPARQSSRANQMMAGIHANSRHAERRLVCFSARARFERMGDTTVLAMLRDISDQGLFFYSSHTPHIGEYAALIFTDGDSQTIASGIVTRIVKYAEGAATGIALRFEDTTRVA